MITGIILASGYSKRMKEDKLLMKIDGTKMIELVIERCKESFLDNIILIYRTEEIKKIGERYNIKTLYNPKAHLGQSEGLKLGVKEAKNSEAYMFLVGDQPFITAQLIDTLIEEYRLNRASIVVPYYNCRRGMPTIFSSTFRDELLKVEGDKGGRDIIEKNASLVRKVFIDDKNLGMDIDTPEDFRQLNIKRMRD
jgi:molybdenum cofactor cytidylyltransferase